MILWYYFTVQFEQIVPYWALGMVVGSCVSVFGKQKIHRLLETLQSKRLGVLSLVPASIIGIASPLTLFGTVPIAASFSEKGMRDDWLAAFMVSSILLNPQLIMYSAALGPSMLTIRIITCFLCGIAAGVLIRMFYISKGQSFFRFSGFTEPEDRDTDPHLLLRLLKNIWRNVKATGPYFLIGVALAAAFQRYVPESFMIGLFGNDRPLGVLMAASIGVPVYACGGGTIPLLQQWLASGMSTGAATGFMISGQAAKITNLTAIKTVLGSQNFLIYFVYILVFAVAAGLLVNLLIGSQHSI